MVHGEWQLRVNDSRLMIHGSRFTVNGLILVHGN